MIKLGIIGMSEGNGHPYSWSAIFNGCDFEYMNDCPFPVIPKYLSKQNFPDDCITECNVTHIWTQDKNISDHVAKASKIPNVVDRDIDMIGHVDGILLARDDSENHYKMAKPFIEAGLPIYIDKPLCTTTSEAERIYALEKYEGQIFTGSAVAYSNAINISENDRQDLGVVKYIDAVTPKKWETYAIHIIEPVLKIIDHSKNIINYSVNNFNGTRILVLNWEQGLITSFRNLSECLCPIKITLYGTKSVREINFPDTFSDFKNTLNEFINIVQKKKKNESKKTTLKSIELIEKGL
jgi:hypothetical protein